MVALLVMFAVLPFAPPPSSPPAIAEVAPKALEQIVEAPPEQATKTGGNEGHVGAAPAKISPSGLGPSAKAVASGAPEQISPFHCVGNPPRQIEDPQSPPCVPMFEGDNGGATYQGVTKDTITVVVPNMTSADPRLAAYEGFFNARFNFYGRKLRLIGINSDKDNNANEATEAQELAAKVDDEYKAFASLPLLDFQGTSYYRELARRKVMVAASYSHYSQKQLQASAPYVWQYGMSLDKIMQSTADWMCQRLVGEPAHYTQDLQLKDKKRVFGLITQDAAANPMDSSPLVSGLKACGAQFASVKHLSQLTERGSAASPPYSQNPDLQAAVLSMKDAHVTTLLCLCQVPTAGSAAEYAASQNYFPEWPSASYLHYEVLFVQQQNNQIPQQRANQYGLSFLPRLIRAADDPSIWALREQNPKAFPTTDDNSNARQLFIHDTYRSLLLLASGIQMAGPHLTPQTFAAGLQSTTFPNPISSIRPGAVGFLGGSYSMMLDATEYWWSNDATSPYVADGARGAWCYVAGGTRRRLGEWPKGPTDYQSGVCDSGS
jgi:hypothetical protein